MKFHRFTESVERLILSWLWWNFTLGLSFTNFSLLFSHFTSHSFRYYIKWFVFSEIRWNFTGRKFTSAGEMCSAGMQTVRSGYGWTQLFCCIRCMLFIFVYLCETTNQAWYSVGCAARVNFKNKRLWKRRKYIRRACKVGFGGCLLLCLWQHLYMLKLRMVLL